jgi:DNA-binding MarR family transcriptional regulator
MATTTPLGTDLVDLSDPDPGDSAASQLVHRITVTAGLLLNRLEGLLRDHGLTSGSFNVLQAVAAADDPLTPSEISTRMPVPVTTATMTGVLDTLERRGLIARRPHPTDRRRVLIELQDSGRELLRSTVPIVHDMQASWVGPLAHDTTGAMLDALGRLEDRLRGPGR